MRGRVNVAVARYPTLRTFGVVVRKGPLFAQATIKVCFSPSRVHAFRFVILPRFRGAFEATFDLEADNGRADNGITVHKTAGLHG